MTQRPLADLRVLDASQMVCKKGRVQGDNCTRIAPIDCEVDSTAPGFSRSPDRRIVVNVLCLTLPV